MNDCYYTSIKKNSYMLLAWGRRKFKLEEASATVRFEDVRPKQGKEKAQF